MNRDGFSLVEMVIVMLVVAIIALAVIPKFLDTSQMESMAAAETAATDIRAVQSLAMYTGMPRSIAFSSGSSNYIAGGLIPSNRVLPGNAVVTSSRAFTFNSFGEPNISAPVTLDFYSGGNTTTLTMVPYTGQVSVE